MDDSKEEEFKQRLDALYQFIDEFEAIEQAEENSAHLHAEEDEALSCLLEADYLLFFGSTAQTGIVRSNTEPEGSWEVPSGDVTEQEAPLSLSPTSTMSSIKRRGGNGEENLGSKKRVEMLARYESSPYTPLKKVQSQRRKPIPFARDDEATPEANPFFKSHAESPSTAAQATFALPTRPAPAEDESAPQDVEQPTVTSITTISAGPVTLAALRIPRVETIQFRIKGKSGNHDQIFDLTRMFNACQNLAIKQVSIFRMWYEKESPGRRIDNWTNPNCYRQFKLIHKPSAWQSKVGRTRACQTCASQGYPCVIRPNYKSATKSVRGRRTVAGPDAVIEFLPLNHDAAGVEYTDEEYWVQGGLDAAEGAVRRDLEGRGKGKGVKGKGKAKVVESTEEEAEDDPASG